MYILTLEELSSYYKLKLLIEVLENELFEIRAKAYGAKTSGGFSDIPGGKAVSDKTGKYASAITEKERKMSELYEEAEQKRAEILDYILFTVAQNDVVAAAVMHWRFIGCLEWFKVGQKTNMSGDAARKICMRYIKNHKK